jgi:ribonuclease HI
VNDITYIIFTSVMTPGHTAHYSADGGGNRRVGIDVYADGSCIGNGCKGAIGGIGVFFGPSDPYNVSESIRPLNKGRRDEYSVTSQSMELAACTKAVQQCLARSDESDSQIHIRLYTDSDYVIYAVTSDSAWQNKQTPIDRVYIKKLQRACGRGVAAERKASAASSLLPPHQRHQVTFIHISAHQNVPSAPYLTELAHWMGNREADALAYSAAQLPTAEGPAASPHKRQLKTAAKKK